MDYSAISNDPEHPTGASPWGSPRADRTSFPTAGNGDIPSSPLPGQHHSSETADRDEEAIAQAADLSAQLQSAQLGDPDYGEEQSQFAVHQSPADQQRQQLPARYQTGVRQPSRQPAPAYKIQAKITGLERTGKKDPILRFDVHVSRRVNVGRCTVVVADLAPLFHDRPISLNSAPPNTAMFAGLTPSLSSSLTTCSRPIRKLLSPPCRRQLLPLGPEPMKMKSGSRLQCNAG